MLPNFHLEASAHLLDACSLRGTFLKGMPTAEASPTFRSSTPSQHTQSLAYKLPLSNTIPLSWSISLVVLWNPFLHSCLIHPSHSHLHSFTSHAQTISKPHASHIQPLHNPLLCCYTHTKPLTHAFVTLSTPSQHTTFNSYITFPLHQFVIYLNSFSTFSWDVSFSIAFIFILSQPVNFQMSLLS